MFQRKRSIHEPYDSNQFTRYVELYLVNDFRTVSQQPRERERESVCVPFLNFMDHIFYEVTFNMPVVPYLGM